MSDNRLYQVSVWPWIHKDEAGRGRKTVLGDLIRIEVVSIDEMMKRFPAFVSQLAAGLANKKTINFDLTLDGCHYKHHVKRVQ
jgi:hypothetical protein